VNAPQQSQPSGLRNPARTIRGLGAATLALETLVLLMAIAPLTVLGVSGATIAVVVVLAVLTAALAALIGRRWAWHAASALQALLVLAGVLHWSLGAVGVIFALVWAYVWHVRRVILGTGARPPADTARSG